MGPAISHVAQLADEGALCLTERLAEDEVPRVPHHRENCSDVPSWLGGGAEEFGLLLADRRARLFEPLLRVLRLQLPLHEGGEALLKQVEGLADALLVGDGHRLAPC